MNFICLSPYFPPNYYNFSVSLKKFGITVLGLGDAPYDFLHPDLKEALTEYYRVDDLHNYEQLIRALGYFTHRYGKIDGIDSHNEYWLETEAKLRQDFNIDGLKPVDMKSARKKSEMKRIFQKAGLHVARGILARSKQKVFSFAGETGYPLVAKPDSGVGAANTYKINNKNELSDFLQTKPVIDYLLEEFVAGDIYSFDGLIDREGELIYSTVMKNEKGVMEVVLEDSHVYYYTLRHIPNDLETEGKKLLDVFQVKGRFFHFEFFREESSDRLIPLEVNLRPPGGFTTEMFNFASDINVYDEWAAMIAGQKLDTDYTKKYHVCFVSRKYRYNYRYSHEELLDKFGSIIIFYDRIHEILSRAMGNYCYLLRSADLDTIFSAQQAIHELNNDQ